MGPCHDGSMERIAEAAPGAELRLSRPEWYRLFTAAGYALS